MRHSAEPMTAAPRRGLTLVEVMIALVLVAVGLLGIAGASALSLRALGERSGALRATRQASLRMARLESGGCPGARGGVAMDEMTGMRERWVVGPPLAGTVLVDDSLAWTSGGRPRQLVVHSALLC
jgi:prepilin-type N-terminal cleavage/methylation domain-containing protein